MAWRRSRASRGAWLGGEEEGVGAELPGASVRLRDGCGRGSGVGGDELRSVARGRESRGEEGVQIEREGRSGGCRGFTRASRGKRQAGGGRDACRRAAATHPRAHWHEVEDDWHMGLVGWLLCWAR